MASVFKRGGKGNRGGYWYVSWFDHTGKRRSKCARTTDKATAERIGAKLETEAAKRREGLIDPQLEGYVREAKRPLAELVTEYKAKLVANGRTERYIAEAVGYVERFAEAEGIETAATDKPRRDRARLNRSRSVEWIEIQTSRRCSCHRLSQLIEIG